jgi:hypothetical protein
MAAVTAKPQTVYFFFSDYSPPSVAAADRQGMRNMLSTRVFRLFAARAPLLLAVWLLWTGCNGEDVNAPTTGEIRVTISTGGPNPALGGYTLTLDSQPSIAVSGNATLALSVEEGVHVLELGAVAPSCVVAEGARREVQVTAGEATTVTFDVICGPTTGGVRVTTITSGPLPDPDGYAVTIDESAPQATGANASLVLNDLTPGDHTVLLSGVADNCSVTTQDPLTIAVAAGVIAEATFEIVCSATVQQWTPIASETRADLSDIWASSATDLFVVGEIVRDEPFQLASVIRHYDGTQWVQQFRQANLELLALWGSSPTDVYAIGFDFFSPDSRVFHFDGTQWSAGPRFEPGPFEESLILESVWGSSASDVFAVGSAFNGEFDQSLIVHYNGSDWQRMTVTGTVNPQLADVWGSSSTDVYAVGRDDAADPSIGAIVRFDGVAWTQVFDEEGLTPTSIWGSSATDIFVAGFQVDGFEAVGTILHYDGSQWSHMALPAVGALRDVWGSSPMDVFAVGDEGVILHYDGTAWTSTNPSNRSLLGIWGVSPVDVFAVGQRGTVLHGTP